MRVWIGCLAMSSWLGTNAVFVLDSVSLPAFLPKSWKDLELCYIGGARWEGALELGCCISGSSSPACCVVGDRGWEDLRTCGQVLAPSKVSPLDVFAVWSVTKALVM